MSVSEGGGGGGDREGEGEEEEGGGEEKKADRACSTSRLKKQYTNTSMTITQNANVPHASVQ